RRQQAAIIFAQLRDLTVDHAADRLGKLTLDLGHGARQCPPALVLGNDSAIAQVAQQIRHEQWTAFRLGVHELAEIRRELMAGKFEQEISFDLRAIQELERKLAADTACLPAGLELEKRVLGQQELRGAISKNQEQTHRIQAPGEVGEQVDGRNIGPVQVVEEHHQRFEARHVLEKGSEFPLHSLLGGVYVLRPWLGGG